MNYNELKFIAESKNYMIKDLAAEMGMTSNGLKRSVEGGNLTMEKIKTLCQLLKITPNEFFSWTEGNNYAPDGTKLSLNEKFESTSNGNNDLGSLMNILSRFLMNQEQYHSIMKEMMTIYERINNK